MNRRHYAGWVYFAIGMLIVLSVIFVRIPIIVKIIREISPILWCVGWAAIGAGAGLINTRDHGLKKTEEKTEGKTNIAKENGHNLLLQSC